MGDQPEDIYARVKAMIMRYIKGEEKIILCIIPANGPDFATAEGVLLARSVDPQQRRTLGVITKVDRAEAGIRSKLLAEDESDLKLSLGFIAVRNRTQEEVAAREPLGRVRAKDRARTLATGQRRDGGGAGGARVVQLVDGHEGAHARQRHEYRLKVVRRVPRVEPRRRAEAA